MSRNVYTYTLVLALIPGIVLAQADTPLMVPADQPAVVRIERGVVVVDDEGKKLAVEVPAGFWVNDVFAQNVEKRVDSLKEQVVRLEAEKESYKQQAIEVGAQPGLTWPVVLALVAGGLAVGAGAVLGAQALGR